MPRPFAKYEGLGNDFIVLDEAEWPAADVTPNFARALCDRHFGIGADGVLWLDAREPEASLVILNADGSRPEMCGNGVRCIAGFLHDTGRLERGAALALRTDAGVRITTLVAEGPAIVEVDMGPVRVARDDVRLGEAIAIAVDVGNPHAVLFDPRGDDEAFIAAAERRRDVWPHGVNVEFVTSSKGGGFAARIHERGVGWTRACGTGACAVVAAAVARRDAPTGAWIDVALPGGVLSVAIERTGEAMCARMRGPARRVFRGEIDVERFPR